MNGSSLASLGYGSHASDERHKASLALDASHFQRKRGHLGRQLATQLRRYLLQHIQGLPLFLEFLQVIKGGKAVRDLALVLFIGFGIEHREFDRMTWLGLPGRLII